MTDTRTCRGCSSTWTGNLTCHCIACHHTFGSIRGFDAHRWHVGRGDGCVPPDHVGVDGSFLENYDGVWFYKTDGPRMHWR